MKTFHQSAFLVALLFAGFPRREMLGIEGLREIVHEACNLPLAEMKKQILNRVAAWRGGPVADDVSLVVLELS